MEYKATPRPWRIDKNDTPPRPHPASGKSIRGADNWRVAESYETFGTNDAALIVRAVNSYEAHRALVEAAQNAIEWCGSQNGEIEACEEALAAISADLTKALAAVEAAEKA